MQRYQKVLLTACITALLLMGGVQLYFSFFLDGHLKQTLITHVREATGNTYTLEIEDFDLSVWGCKLRASDINLTKKNQSEGADIKVDITHFDIDGIHFLELLLYQRLEVQQIDVTSPKITLTSSGTQLISGKSGPLKKAPQQLSKIALQLFESITIPQLNIRGHELVYNRSDLDIAPHLSFDNAEINISNIRIDSSSLNSEKFIPSDNIKATVRDFTYQTPNELYALHIQEIRFSSMNQYLTFVDLSLTPKLDRDSFAKQVGHEIDRLTLDISRIYAKDINFDKMNRVEGISAALVSVEKPIIEIYRDKRPPFPPDTDPSLPREALHSVSFPYHIDRLLISEGEIRYSELLPQAHTSGHISFTDLSATFKNLTNKEHLPSNNHPPSLHVETKIMNRGHLTVDFTFPPGSNDHHIEGNMGPLNLEILNDALVPLAFVRIDQGKILGMNFKMDLDKQRASGTVAIRYENLQISIIDIDSGKENFGNKLTSLLANTFRIKSDNTGNNPRIGEIDFERDNNKSVFNYWWKSLLSGLKSTIGL